MGNNFKTVRITITYYNLTDAVFAEKTIPQMRFLQVLTLWTCFPCMFDMSTMLKLCWNCFRAFWAVSYGRFLKLLPILHFAPRVGFQCINVEKLQFKEDFNIQKFIHVSFIYIQKTTLEDILRHFTLIWAINVYP